MRINRMYLYILVFITLSGCQNYKTFYHKNASINSTTPNKDNRADLSYTNNDSIQSKLSQYRNLCALDLSNNLDLDLDAALNTISNPSRLRVLILNDNDLKKLPQSIKRFPELRQISLNGNPNINLEQAFDVLKELPIEFINLQNNKLTTLPENINQVTSLEDLNLSKNQINDGMTFHHLSKLPKLNSLWLTQNEIQQLPQELFELNQIRNLYLEKNNLNTVPLEISQMKKVWVVHIGHNNFKTMPEAFAKMPSLLLLHINNCHINSIPEVYATKESNIKGLILDNNLLTTDDKKRWKKEFNNHFVLSLK